MPSMWIGESTKDKLIRDGVRGKRAISSIASTSLVMPVNENAAWGRIQDSLRNQLKEDGPSSVQRLSKPKLRTWGY